ncbi:MAG: hypothetical protein IJ697_01610 [Synergistaceae bacterium]|nr:hypothetical protein [Synergistaceae bacterium]
MESIIEIALACILSTVLFAALIIYISKHPQKSTKPLKIIFVFMFISGMILYCYCHYQVLEKANQSGNPENSLFAWAKDAWASKILYISMRSVIDVGMMFYGRADSDAFYKLDEAKDPLYVCLFWLINVVSFCTAASALLIHFGNDLLRWIKIAQTKVSDIDLVYGVSPDSIAFGRNIAETKGRMLIYVDSIIGEDFEASIRDMGGLSYSDKDALKATQSFLKEIRVRPLKTRLRLFALSYKYDNNLQYARMMSESLQKAGILPEQTELVLLGSDEWKGIIFQSGENQYGYGKVLSFDEYEMSARLLINKYPPCNAIHFDTDGRATENMEVLIVGFGRIGHEVLRKLIANGQFEGSRFHATIYQPDVENIAGFFKSQYPLMFAKENYDIDFQLHGGRGSEIFSFLRENAPKLKYIVICLEDRDLARDIAVRMVESLQIMGYSLNVYTCDSKSVRCYSQYARECETYMICDSDLLYSGELDRYAMELNHRYCGGSSLNEDWKKCAYFDRMSSRASVDYLIPVIRRITAKTNSNALTHEQRENLAKSEHLRWCAFHYTFGFDVMDKNEFIQRVKDRQNEIRQFGKSSIKVTKDNKKLTHVCLVDWDELDEISRIENSLTHGNRDYKESDRMNVDMVAEIMRDNGEKSN